MRPNDRSSGYMYYPRDLYHHGIIGQKWGQRRYQNRDGSLTPLGREHYGRGDGAGTIDRVKSGITKAKDATVKGASVARQVIGNAMNKAQRIIGNSANTARNTVSKAVNNTRKAIGDTVTGTRNAIGNTVNSIQNAINNATNRTGEWVADRGHDAGYIAGRVGEGVTRGVKTKLAQKAPFMLNDEELTEYTKRLQMEKSYKQLLADKKRIDTSGPARKFVGEVLSSGAKTIASKGFNKLADKMFSDKDETTDYNAVLSNPLAFTDKQVRAALDRQNTMNSLRRGNASDSSLNVNDVLSNPQNYSNEQIQTAVNRQNNLNSLRESSRRSTSNGSDLNVNDVLSNPQNYSNEQIQTALNRQNNLNSLRDSARGRSSSISNNAREIVANPDAWTDQQVSNALRRQQNLERLRNMNPNIASPSEQNNGETERTSGQRYRLNNELDLTDYSSDFRQRRRRQYDRNGHYMTT